MATGRFSCSSSWLLKKPLGVFSLPPQGGGGAHCSLAHNEEKKKAERRTHTSAQVRYFPLFRCLFVCLFSVSHTVREIISNRSGFCPLHEFSGPALCGYKVNERGDLEPEQQSSKSTR